MSQETIQWLNTMVLVGMTDKRGNAWHYKASAQGDEPNHYPGFIPVEDVRRRLFNFTVIEAPAYYAVPCSIEEATTMDENGLPVRFVRSEAGRKGMLASDNLYDLGCFKDGYQGHDYEEWLLRTVAVILDADLGITSAGLLRNRGVAWVEVSMPENITTPEGVEFRPNLLAGTSFDGSLSTTFKRVHTNVVCDNTLAGGLAEDGQEVKIRHSRFSDLRIADARQALAVVHTMADDFAAEVKRLCEWEVSPTQWLLHLDLTTPLPEADGRGRTLATNKRDTLDSLWRTDERVAPWSGTAFGVLQAHNTYLHHFATVRGTGGTGIGRGLRNAENALLGKTAAHDAKVLSTLAQVCAA